MARHDEDKKVVSPRASEPEKGLSWGRPFSWLGALRRSIGTGARKGSADSDVDRKEGEPGGWWSRYEHESISMADLALTLVSACRPRDMPALLARVQGIRKNKRQIPLNDALLLHEILEDHALDLEDALALYSKASPAGSIGMDDFARAAKVVSGKELSRDCIWVLFRLFDNGEDGRLQHEELRRAVHNRLSRLPGQRDSPDVLTRFVRCVRESHE